MSRFHLHLHVADLAESVRFYSQLFAAQPSRLEADYAKWMLDAPRLNFAISTRGEPGRIDHLGFQADDAAELQQLRERARASEGALLEQGSTACCYARSEKYWVTDPQGVAWEQFQTLADIPVFGGGASAGAGAGAGAGASTGAQRGGACC